MKSIEILALGLRVIGIYGLVVSVQFIFNLYYTFTQISNGDGGTSGINILYISILIILVLVSTAFIKFPITVAKILMPKTKEESPVFNGSIKDLEIVAFTIFGLILFVSSLPNLVNGIFHWWQSSQMDILGLFGNPGANIQILVSLINMGIGLLLTFKSNSLSNFIARVRGYGPQSS